MAACSDAVPAGELPRKVNTEQASSCNSVQNWETLLPYAENSILIFGEVHGTNESPAFIQDVICSFIQRNIPIKIGLEADIPTTSDLDEALEDGYDRDSDLNTDGLWSIHDGRSSEAIARLLEVVGGWKVEGKAVSVFPFEPRLTGGVNEVARAKGMAEAIDEAALDYEGAIIVITGINHAYVGEQEEALLPDGTYGPTLTMSARLTVRQPISIQMAWEAGTAWRYTEDGPGVLELETYPEPYEGKNIILPIDFDSEKYHYRYYVGPISYSPPEFLE